MYIEKMLWKFTEEVLEIYYGSGVMQQKVGMGLNLPLPGSMCVKRVENFFELKALVSQSHITMFNMLKFCYNTDFMWTPKSVS